MLSGRPVGGREVVERLERLEKEHAATVSELTATKQQLEIRTKNSRQFRLQQNYRMDQSLFQRVIILQRTRKKWPTDSI